MNKIKKIIVNKWVNSWYQKPRWWNYLCLPLTLIFSIIVVWRREFYKKFNNLRSLKVPVIIVGNLTVGGTGKTPLVIFLANYLRSKGFRPGIVSRGYGGDNRFPNEVMEHSDPNLVGDEAVMIVRRTGCPMVVCRYRNSAVDRLLMQYACDVILSDDGLQHYAMNRDMEIIVIDGERRFGNKWCLPAGPLREPLQRLKEANIKVSNGGIPLKDEFSMGMDFEDPIHLISGKAQDLSYFVGKKVHALAGTGNPSRFFKSLEKAGLIVIPHEYSDHHVYELKDLLFNDNIPLIMTQKDAVKCEALTKELKEHNKTDLWYLPAHAKLSNEFCMVFMEKFLSIKVEKRAHNSD